MGKRFYRNQQRRMREQLAQKCALLGSRIAAAEVTKQALPDVEALLDELERKAVFTLKMPGGIVVNVRINGHVDGENIPEGTAINNGLHPTLSAIRARLMRLR